MAWMRMMGADSVAYHRATVLERADDHPGQALAYYASRGETPLVWGGSGARTLGLVGAVTEAQYEAVYGPGGAVDPTTGERLVSTTRPGMELVIAAHKSVAELGVIGRAEDMHRILDAERDATLAHLDDLVRRRGGRRGSAAVATPTAGLTYAVTRHATSRAGDPAPHDHVLVANLLRMDDDKGGWKAADTSLWREHLHAATMVGRVASARKAAQLGYGIVRDDGPSGRLGQWAIAGVPEAAMEIHSKRAAEITAETQRRGFDSYRARGIVARDHRAPKRHEPVVDLLARWQGELDSVGWPVAELERSVAQARSRSRRPRALDEADRRRIVAETLALDGPLAARKVFSRRDVIVAVAPKLFGQEPSELYRTVDKVLADPEAIPLMATPMARERAYATATVIATEQAIAAAVEVEVTRTDAPAVDEMAARRAMAHRETELAAHLTVGQRAAVLAVTTSGRGTELVVGLAGSGKTTALAAVREAFEGDGFEVIGTSTSGQAARTLKRQAGIEASRTLASLTWRLDHGQLELTPRHVVVVDEAAMSEDAALLRLLSAASTARAKVVLVGDHRQLGAVGPGGGFESLVKRYGAAVHVLADNVRQRDVAERAALVALRDGDVAKAVAWYARNDRIVTAPDRSGAVEAVVAGWAADVGQGHQAAMYAWRRVDVAELNRLGREAWRSLGRLGKEELVAPGGAPYAVGDRVVALAPGAGGSVVTSETGTVAALDLDAKALVVRMDDGGQLRRLEAEEIAIDRLAHAYAVTVHRSQGSTVQRAHSLEDGGGRELAYVKMSRARDRSTVYVVADNVEQATEDLVREWSAERRPVWVIDSGTPVTDPAAVEASLQVARPMREALRRGRLAVERAAIVAVIPPDPSAEIRDVEQQRARISAEREDLAAGTGRYRSGPIAHAVGELQRAEMNVARLERNVSRSGASRKDRRHRRAELDDWRGRRVGAARELSSLTAPDAARLDADERQLTGRLPGLWKQQAAHQTWVARHPEAARRLDDLITDIEVIDRRLGHSRGVPERAAGLDRFRPWTPPPEVPGRHLGIDLEL
ncbi:MAG: AAA family ATPase [Actinomycetota bacterium]|nr:AAA family ATPase [Actinomycetota bacterium]